MPVRKQINHKHWTPVVKFNTKCMFWLPELANWKKGFTFHPHLKSLLILKLTQFSPIRPLMKCSPRSQYICNDLWCLPWHPPPTTAGRGLVAGERSDGSGSAHPVTCLACLTCPEVGSELSEVFCLLRRGCRTRSWGNVSAVLSAHCR